jgi:radical SAM superfamily enzyme
LTLDIVEKGKQFHDQVLVHERYLGMSVTTKSSLMEDHSLEQQEELDGIVDLGKDFGERNHQDRKQELINVLDASDILRHKRRSRAKKKFR